MLKAKIPKNLKDLSYLAVADDVCTERLQRLNDYQTYYSNLYKLRQGTIYSATNRLMKKFEERK